MRVGGQRSAVVDFGDTGDMWEPVAAITSKYLVAGPGWLKRVRCAETRFTAARASCDVGRYSLRRNREELGSAERIGFCREFCRAVLRVTKFARNPARF